ncbi:hypothetical protein LY78DRAFT_585570 [Colletotrichum sublineola]|uniref:Integral membrane protein n=1 Tax=Colletotrichum sublineola TaxID=1173701 RepID=A0A066XMX9_COLSU|nr:hypothetical protein LY78DRAFT_585570 [Colletotrichum sublineola]KDN69024.1 hypothetical protein CSUB01_12483 [Colletotrichum sublineola]
MNASANLRSSYIRTSVLIPIPPTGPDAGDSTLKRRTLRAQAPEVDDAQRQQIVQTLDYLEYQTRCAMDREGSMPSPIKEYSIGNSTVEVQESRGSQAKRMLTIYPFKDMNWVVTMFFVVGSIGFVINGALGLLPIIDPALAFPTLTTVAQPVTILIGAALFMTGGILALFGAFNANRGTLELAGGKSIEGDTNFVYRPALIGSPAWVWIPTAADVAGLLRTLPFKAGMLQLCGGSILSVSAVAGIPGVIDRSDLALTQTLIYMPQVIGGSMFFVANVALMIFAQDVWYKPKFGSGEWLGTACNAFASSGFAITGGLLLLGNFSGASVVSFVGSSSFLTGAIIQWYLLMEFHATPWAS